MKIRTFLGVMWAIAACACGGSPQNDDRQGAQVPSEQSVEADSIDSPESPETSARAVSNNSGSRSKRLGDSIQTTPRVDLNAFIVVSKLRENLSVYGVQDGDTTLLAQYPACMGKNLGDKQKRGDMRTPESPKGKPFFISQIQDAHTWHHDFGDGRGSILAYGHWFLRLNTPGHSGIGIHGSTNNEGTVPGRASEGCIRLRDADIIDLKERFAYVGMPVVVKAEGEE